MHNIRIAILGPDSVGKSTFLNTILTNVYSEITDKKTAFQPEIYHIDFNSENDDPTKIFEKNKIANRKNDKKNIKSIHHNVTMMCETLENQNIYLGNFITLHKTITPIFYKMPGLNEKTLLKHTMETFNEFDIIFLLIDINTCLTTSHEIKLLDSIFSCIQNQQTMFQKELLLYFIANKCDEFSDRYEEMLENASVLIKRYIGDYQLDTSILTIKMIPMSLETAYIYRMQKYNQQVAIDTKYINRFGIDMFGKINWNKMSEIDKKNKLDGIFDDNNFNCMMESCNFIKLKEILEKDLTPTMQFKLVMNKYKQLITEICDLDLVICDKNICFGNDEIQDGYFDSVKKIIQDVTKIILDLKNSGNNSTNDFSSFINPVENLINILLNKYASNRCHIYDHIGELYDSLCNYKLVIGIELENLNNIIIMIKNHIVTYYENGLNNNHIDINVAKEYISHLEKYISDPSYYYEKILINNLNIYNSEPSQIIKYNELISEKCKINLKSIIINQLYNLYCNLCTEPTVKYYNSINIPNYIYAIYHFWDQKKIENKKIYNGYIFDELFFVIYKLYINNKISLREKYVPCELKLEKFLCNMLETDISDLYSNTEIDIKLIKNRIENMDNPFKNTKNKLKKKCNLSYQEDESNTENSSEESSKKEKKILKKNNSKKKIITK